MIFKKSFKLGPLSTFKIGGRADYFCRVWNEEELKKAISWAKQKKISHRIFAGGSNIVFRDKKVKGLIVQIKGGHIRTNKRTRKMVVDAGVPLSEVIKKSIKAGLSGLETLSGIPGTVGGAIVGNAGAYGHSVSEVVKKIEVFDGKKKRWFSKKDCRFAYRESVLKHKPFVVLKVILKLRKGNRKGLMRISQKIIKTRLKKYKPGLKCPGSFFKNVLVKNVSKLSLAKIDRLKIIGGKVPAGYLLEEVGAKGMRVGGVEIAKFHGNLFVNKGKAKAADVKKLASILKRKVKTRFGIKLEEEIRYF